MMATAIDLCVGLRSVGTGRGEKRNHNVAAELTSFIGQHCDRFYMREIAHSASLPEKL